MPELLLPFMDHQIQAYALKHWHCIILQELDPNKISPFLGFQPAKVIRKTLQQITQLVCMIIHSPLCKHLRPRFPFLNVQCLNEGISTNCLYANCCDISHGYTTAHVFYGMMSNCIDVFGHRKVEEGFFHCYSNFVRNEGAPSALRCDNHGLGKNNKVLATQLPSAHEGRIFGSRQPAQNNVETGVIRWLKAATHILLDMMNAPDFVWFLALKYLAKVQKYTWNDERQCIPATAFDGERHDISHLLQFTFQEHVLYLENVSTFPLTGEQPDYFCRFSDNISDSLMFQVYDDQTHCVVDVSVLHPYMSNKWLYWDASICRNERNIHTPPFTSSKHFTHADVTNVDGNHINQYDRDKSNFSNFNTKPTLERVSKF